MDECHVCKEFAEELILLRTPVSWIESEEIWEKVLWYNDVNCSLACCWKLSDSVWSFQLGGVVQVERAHPGFGVERVDVSIASSSLYVVRVLVLLYTGALSSSPFVSTAPFSLSSADVGL